MKKLLALVVLLAFAFVLNACWPGEISVTTEFNADGSGTRYIILEVMDDTLSTEPITNPDDPEGTEGKGAVLNDKHIDGGVIAIQTWLEENAPDFITVHDATVDGYVRTFTMSYEFSSFEDFLDKYETLVNLSPNLSWDDFDATELPTLEVTGSFTKTLTFKESKAIVDASLDWAIDGIYNSIYNEADLAGFVTKADISVLANYSVTINEGSVEELRTYDAAAADGDFTGKVIFVESENFEVTGEFFNTTLLIIVILGVAVVGVGGFFVFKKIKK
ncbi:MAG: hypothetical protein A2Y45_00785 [Tenericutes bacterium GWC2_34_14]|nr:MAG: hypothetical protein A2Y45_00785 [Tenericutes bacterium GWC2_34_14]OHE34531.1 MAG: hypothetical protein A2012_08405 [Tenericutes bacterium GWE2_34_108]OHE35888.1 MAG: hypothetical protein A2Y46_03110 [Tenericutes bacterium GWF1_35_14]OHE39026.1 MAG: hypothetical protein A2Y44_06820 [Tenericutes bacterium GWF2_35_184]OHE42907.1 MAG: hypothetical protein A2221_09415 [Tenericutes bacterium RIFOXYA2_FULL_36_32]OHE46135.1 MAG: hypothetical protein A2308_01085 [Tenericutes bacterium RIFOXYB2